MQTITCMALLPLLSGLILQYMLPKLVPSSGLAANLALHQDRAEDGEGRTKGENPNQK